MKVSARNRPGDQDADRIEPAEERDDDRGEAVAGRDAGLQMPDRTRDLDDAGKARERARDQRRSAMTSWLALKPAKRAARGAAPTTPDLEALDRARRAGSPAADDDDERDDRAEMQAAAFDQQRHRRDRIELGRGREIEALGVAPGPRTR